MANVERTRKLLVRTALVTSSTIATLTGAQNLALLDTRRNEATTETSTAPAATLASTGEQALTVRSNVEIVHAAPSITILRQPGQTGPIQPVTSNQMVIQPPNPVQLAAPQPVIIQGQAPPPVIVPQAPGGSSAPASRTQSSR